MALLNRIFSTARKKLDSDTNDDKVYRSPKLKKQQVRLLLFKESDWSGRKLLFDSVTIDKIKSCSDVIDTVELLKTVDNVDGFSYKYNGPSADANILGDIIYGAVAVTYKGASIKISILEDPLRLLCSKVFVQRARTRERTVGSRQSTQASMSPPDGSTDSLSPTKPLAVPTARARDGVCLSFSLERGDSGFYGDHSPRSSVSSYLDECSYPEAMDKDFRRDDSDNFNGASHVRKVSISSNGSWQRRMIRTMSTRFDFGSSSSGNLLTVPNVKSNKNSYDSQMYSNSSNSGTNESLNSNSTVGSQRSQIKIGFALLITMEEMYLLEELLRHSTQLEAILSRCWRVACAQKPTPISALHDATLGAQRWLEDILSGPRTPPVWLNLLTTHSQQDKLAETVLSDLCFLLHNGDTKNTNFFISTLLSHVLTYHLGWVSSVSPYEQFNNSEQFRSLLTTKNPYNALWAQLSDLCGNIALPPRSARTIVFGKNDKMVKKILSVLTYFIRCGRIKKTLFDCPEFTYEKINDKSDLLAYMCYNSKSDNSVSSNKVKASTGLKRSTTTKTLTTLLSNTEEVVSDQCDVDRTSDSVVFVLGENEKLIGIKNKSNDGKYIKKTPVTNTDEEVEGEKKSSIKCCNQQNQHSKHVKHSGYKFDFDKYPQIVTNYMKSKNLELLDRHYIGKPGNLKLDGYHFDPGFVPPIQEEKCEVCAKSHVMENTFLQTPTNASEFEFMSDVPSQSMPQYAAQTVVENDAAALRDTPTFTRTKVENTVVINPPSYQICDELFTKGMSDLSLKCCDDLAKGEMEVSEAELKCPDTKESSERGKDSGVEEDCKVTVTEFKMPSLNVKPALPKEMNIGYEYSLLGGFTDRYVPDMLLQGTSLCPIMWESSLSRDLEIIAQVSSSQGAPLRSLAIVADTEKWSVNLFRGSSGGMSARVAAMLDALPDMRRARVPPLQCLSFIEGKLRELCVLSKTLADLLMTTDFCDMESLTKSLNIDVNDVPLLMAVATTHTPQIAMRYGISYR